MKVIILIAGLGMLSHLFAQVPKKQSLNRYTRLWTDSPFTAKPEVERKIKESWEKDWVLAGISQMSDGNYFVTVLNKKDRSIRARMDTSGKKSVEAGAQGFTVKEVQVDARDFLKSRAFVSLNGEAKWLSFDENSLKANQSAARPVDKSNSNFIRRTIKINSNGTTTNTSTSTPARTRRVIPGKRN